MFFFDLYKVAKTNFNTSTSPIGSVTQQIEEQLKQQPKRDNIRPVLILENFEALLYGPFSKQKMKENNVDGLLDPILEKYPQVRVIAIGQREAIINATARYEFGAWSAGDPNIVSLLPWNQQRIEEYVNKQHLSTTYHGPYDIPIGAVELAIATYQQHQPQRLLQPPQRSLRSGDHSFLLEEEIRPTTA